MAKAIHPAARARAAKHGCDIIEIDGQFALIQTETGQVSEDRFDRVGEATEALDTDEGIEGITWEEEVEEGDEEEGDEGEGKSGVMAETYHQQYSKNPHGPGCNDDLDCTLRDATRSDGDAKVMDLEKLHAIGQASGLFRLEWTRLNPGMQRMNLANRMRGWLRNNEGFIQIGDKSGRFGIEKKAKKVRKGARDI